jgi:hypothetical protein
MLMKKKCTNLDCRDYDIECTEQWDPELPSYAYCPTCYFGKLDMRLEGGLQASMNPSQDELIAAEFDIRKIIQR